MVEGTLVSAHISNTAAEIVSLERDIPSDTLLNQTRVELAKHKLTPGLKAFSDSFSEYAAGKITTPEFADNLVDEIAEAVCDHAAGVLITEAVGFDLVEACVTAIYTGNALVAPELEFLSVFGASIICNLLVNEALPGIGQLTDVICKEPKPCTKDLLTDSNNCGTCSNVVCKSLFIFSPHCSQRYLSFLFLLPRH